MPVCYRPLFDPNVHRAFIEGGRFSGKTKNTTEYAMAQIMAHPRRDIIIFRAKDNTLSTADYKEVLKIVNSDPVFKRFFIVRKKPLGIHRRDGLGNILFRGGDAVGDDDNRTKGLTTEWPLLMYIISECQEFRTKNAVLQLMDSVDRNFTTKDGNVDPEWKTFITMNPPQDPYHWINDWADELAKNPDWTIIKTTYQDIIMFLNDIDLKKVRRAKIENYQDYAWRYLGVVGGGNGDMYPMLSAKAIVDEDYAECNRDGIFPVAVIVGVDGATENDCTVATPCIVMSDGTMVVSQKHTFRHDPKMDGVIPAYSMCCETGPMYRWFYGYFDRLGEFHKGFVSEFQGLPKYCFVDDAASDLYRYMDIHYGGGDNGRMLVRKAHKSLIQNMVGVVQDAFYQGHVKFARSMRYTKYTGNVASPYKSRFVAFDQFQALKWDRSHLKYDDSIPNDDSDSVTYAIWAYYKNPEKMMFPGYMRK